MANVQLARNLKTLRLKYNYTQKDLSAILNITRQAYSHYEKALREPDLCTLVRFSHFYKAPWMIWSPGSFMWIRSTSPCRFTTTTWERPKITSVRSF